MLQLATLLILSGEKELEATSGYRCPEHNAAVLGTPNSMHLKGEALDIWAPTVRLKTLILDAAHKADLKGIGLGATFIHVDNRAVAATWTYPKKT